MGEMMIPKLPAFVSSPLARRKTLLPNGILIRAANARFVRIEITSVRNDASEIAPDWLVTISESERSAVKSVDLRSTRGIKSKSNPTSFRFPPIETGLVIDKRDSIPSAVEKLGEATTLVPGIFQNWLRKATISASPMIQT